MQPPQFSLLIACNLTLSPSTVGAGGADGVGGVGGGAGGVLGGG